MRNHSSTLASTLLALIGVGLPALLAPTTAVAQQDPKPQYACYIPGSGTVYRIKEPNTPAQCSAGHVEFQISDASDAKGGAGAKPSTGPTGPAGGDLGGSYPNPSVIRLQGQPISAGVPSAGQILTFTNGAWTPQAAGAGTLPTNAAGAFDFSNSNGLVSTNLSSSGAIPISGPGTRFMWYPSMAALRAGRASGTEWDVGNVGGESIALGGYTKASGQYSVALGYSTTASGTSSTALGQSTKAIGIGSTALGSTAQATGDFSTALGSGTTASGQGSVAMGEFTNSPGRAALAAGDGSYAAGDYSAAIGHLTTAGGPSSMAFGEFTTAIGGFATAMGKSASTNSHMGAFVYGDASTSTVVKAVAANQFVVRAQGLWFGTTSAPTATVGRFLETSTGAYLSSGGTWTNSSDVNRKHDFRSVDGEQVLEKVAAMPVATWSYLSEDSTVRHMGPTAQDFRSAFGLGDTDKAIATVDADGVSLAAIKALVQRTTALQRDNDELRSALADLYRRLSEIEQPRR